jgi:hypothetical protein
LGVLLAGVIALTPLLAGEFMPSFREGHFVAQVSARVPGTSLGEMARLGERISAEILALPYIATVAHQIGRAEQGEDTWGPERSEFHIELKPNNHIDQGRVQQELRELFARYPAVQSEVLTFLGDRVSESLSGETAQGRDSRAWQRYRRHRPCHGALDRTGRIRSRDCRCPGSPRGTFRGALRQLAAGAPRCSMDCVPATYWM